MKRATRSVDIVRIKGVAATKEKDTVVRESSVTIFLNDEPTVTLQCTPKDLESLAAGFLFSEGLIKHGKDVRRVYGDARDCAVWVDAPDGIVPPNGNLTRRTVTSGCGKGLTFAGSVKHIMGAQRRAGKSTSSDIIASLMKEFQKKSQTYRTTGGVHSAALADDHGILAFSEDIGRHNAIDKVVGERILKGKETRGLILMTSGRVSSDILVKAARARTPIIVSRSAPTDLAVKLARELGITVVGFARGSRMNVYTHGWRIESGLGGR